MDEYHCHSTAICDIDMVLMYIFITIYTYDSV